MSIVIKLWGKTQIYLWKESTKKKINKHFSSALLLPTIEDLRISVLMNKKCNIPSGILKCPHPSPPSLSYRCFSQRKDSEFNTARDDVQIRGNMSPNLVIITVTKYFLYLIRFFFILSDLLYSYNKKRNIYVILYISIHFLLFINIHTWFQFKGRYIFLYFNYTLLFIYESP